MDNVSIFFGTFLSYILLMVIIVCVAALGFFVGRVLRKNKDSKNVSGSETADSVPAETGK